MFPDLTCRWFIPKCDDLHLVSPLKQRLSTTVILSQSGWSGECEILVFFYHPSHPNNSRLARQEFLCLNISDLLTKLLFP